MNTREICSWGDCGSNPSARIKLATHSELGLSFCGKHYASISLLNQELADISQALKKADYPQASKKWYTWEIGYVNLQIAYCLLKSYSSILSELESRLSPKMHRIIRLIGDLERTLGNIDLVERIRMSINEVGKRRRTY